MMKKLIVLFLALALFGCAHARYQDGSRVAEYTSLCRTADVINVDLNQGTVKVEGQKIDAKVLEAITQFLKAIQ
ncbi:MAG: hypothetical protein LLG40_09905 [Deltaproteobacteria bacterium]|nr:hypothetical protein [Deltaproteobacteria bacterium]